MLYWKIVEIGIALRPSGWSVVKIQLRLYLDIDLHENPYHGRLSTQSEQWRFWH